MINQGHIFVKPRKEELRCKNIIQGGEKMRQYVKPVLDMVVLCVEERFASGSGCTVTGSCSDVQIIAMAKMGYIVNYN